MIGFDSETDWLVKMDKFDKEKLSKKKVIQLFELDKMTKQELKNLCDFRGIYFNILIQENLHKNGLPDEDDPDLDEQLKIYEKENERLTEKMLFLEEVIDEFFFKFVHEELEKTREDREKWLKEHGVKN